MIQLELQPEVESRLIAEAQARGLSVDRYIESLVTKPIVSPLNEEPRTPERQREIEAAIERLRGLREGLTTGGLSIKELINEGRKY
jgi:hypothetical protein